MMRMGLGALALLALAGCGEVTMHSEVGGFKNAVMTCDSFESVEVAQRYQDIHHRTRTGLDPDRDGIVCEDMR
ncbi:Excalibur calcium-binding domain-containing protein [Limimonas halophila]|uniref:Excalibur calcium-binding domain-containing protein n=1 Tax=Limimonas halophila TaxID=1082479 RepID=A0A1G7L9E8_9PROT|nr:excalibur calcium-binding domain-containing protein [Limimonas halophila]SDF46083.1 Excalibur calcium-binding domain-containing protein [Limimonas halophila]